MDTLWNPITFSLRRRGCLCMSATHSSLNPGYSIHHKELLSIDAKGEIMAALRRLAAQGEEQDASDLRTMVLDLERLPRQPAIQLHDEVNDIDVDPSDIGVGVSQVIPV